MIERRIESCPRLSSIVCSVEAITTRDNVLVRTEDEHVMNVVLNAVAAPDPRPALVLTHVDATGLDAGNHAIGHFRMYAKTPHVGLVAMTWGMPLISRREVLEAREFVSRVAAVS
jgi:hypothetical protein